MATKADVRDKALKELGVLSAGDTASAEDAADVEDAIDYLHEEFVDNGLVAFVLTAIPAAAVDPFAILVAASVWRAYNGEQGLVEAEQKAGYGRSRATARCAASSSGRTRPIG
jgi:hypothetical protein